MKHNMNKLYDDLIKQLIEIGLINTYEKTTPNPLNLTPTLSIYPCH